MKRKKHLINPMKKFLLTTGLLASLWILVLWIQALSQASLMARLVVAGGYVFFLLALLASLWGERQEREEAWRQKYFLERKDLYEGLIQRLGMCLESFDREGLLDIEDLQEYYWENRARFMSCAGEEVLLRGEVFFSLCARTGPDHRPPEPFHLMDRRIQAALKWLEAMRHELGLSRGRSDQLMHLTPLWEGAPPRKALRRVK